MTTPQDVPRTIVRSAIRTPDGTLLVSRGVHDYVTHFDTKSGETYMLDGGLAYTRTSVNRVPATDESVYIEDGIERVREVVEWGTRGPGGTGPVRRLLLKDMATDHIQACLDTQSQMSGTYRTAFNLELNYRNQK